MGFLSSLLSGAKKVYPAHIGDDATFRAVVVGNELPVILDVWGPNCPPCKMLEPIIVKLAGKYEGRVQFAELSTQSDLALTQRLRISATPSILVFNKGKEMGRELGFKPQSWFEEMIEAEFPDA